MRLRVAWSIAPRYRGSVENPRKVVLLALSKGWWFRPLYEELRYGEKVLCFQFVDENKRLSDAAFEKAIFDRKPKHHSAMIALLTAANHLAQKLPKRLRKTASIHILNRANEKDPTG
jgi:hypothetical protein